MEGDNSGQFKFKFGDGKFPDPLEEGAWFGIEILTRGPVSFGTFKKYTFNKDGSIKTSIDA